jgi:hypothetical protein
MSKEISPYMRLPLGWRETEGVIELPPIARDLLAALVEHCQVRRNGGVMNEMQVRTICRTMRRGHWALVQLVSAGVLKVVNPRPLADHYVTTTEPLDDHYVTTSRPLADHYTTTTGPVVVTEWSRSGREEVTEWSRIVFENPSYWFISGAPTAGQGPDEVPRARPRAGARVGALVRREEREEEENRPPSGSGRFSSARTAPRNASGAARPAPEEEKDSEENAAGESGDHGDGGDSLAEDGPRMSQREAMKAIRKAIGKSSMSSGKPAQMRKYPVELNSLSEPSLPVELNGRYE